MKYLVSTLLLTMFLVACSGPEANQNEIPEDLGAMKELLKAKRLESKELSNFVEQLEMAIAEKDTSSVEKKQILVTTLPVQRMDFKHYVNLQGTVQADDMVAATSEVAGRILDLKVQEGDNVKRGQLIAKLDLEAVKKQMLELGTSLSLAKTVYERQKRLWDQNIGSEIQFLEAKNSVERLEKNLDLLRLQLSKEEVYAPISGEVETVMVHAGEIASPGMPIVQILNTNKLKVVAEIPETYLGDVRKGEKVKVRIPALNEERELSVTQIGNVINAANRTFDIEMKVPGNSTTLKPNLLVEVLVNDFTAKEAVAIPLEVVQQEVGGKDFVYITMEGPEGLTAKKVYVTTGESYEGNILITQGLNGDEVLIMEGARGLTDNTPVKVVANGAIGSAE